MKSGFYLRPDGEEIIEVWHSFNGLLILKFNKTSRGVVFYKKTVSLLVGNWIYLGGS